MDSKALEEYSIQRKWKVYFEGDQLEEYKKREQLIALLKFFKIPWEHIAQSSALSRIIVATPVLEREGTYLSW